MLVYRVDFYDKDLGTQVTWHPSDREARKHFNAQKKERGTPSVGPEGVHPMNIPRDKKGLLQWLNAHFNTDNG